MSRKSQSCQEATRRKPDGSLVAPGMWELPASHGPAYSSPLEIKERPGWPALRWGAGRALQDKAPALKVSSTDRQGHSCEAPSAEKRASQFDRSTRWESLCVNAVAPSPGVYPPCAVRAPEDSWRQQRGPDAPGGHRPPPDPGWQGSPSFRPPCRWCGCFSGKGGTTLTSRRQGSTGKRAHPGGSSQGTWKHVPLGCARVRENLAESSHAQGEAPGPPGPFQIGFDEGGSGSANESLV